MYNTRKVAGQHMSISWNDKDPIYRQLHDRIVASILEGVFLDGDGLPSVRQLASEHRINPITVSKSLQLLVDDGLVEKRRGLGMFIKQGAATRLKDIERQRFLTEEWPLVVEKILRLGLSKQTLLADGELDK
jgi:GntR family transcriptional regulator